MDIFKCSACGGDICRDEKLGLGVCRDCGRINHYAFISYSSQDQQAADALFHIFEEQHIPVWMAPYDMPVGRAYASVLTDALENCSCMVLLLTNASQSSSMVLREVETIVSMNKPILPVKLEELELNKEFRFYIKTNYILALPQINEQDPKFQMLLRNIKSIVGERYLTPPAAEEHPEPAPEKNPEPAVEKTPEPAPEKSPEPAPEPEKKEQAAPAAEKATEARGRSGMMIPLLCLAAAALIAVTLIYPLAGALCTLLLSTAGAWKIFEKLGEPGWKALIPVYSSWTEFKYSWKPVMAPVIYLLYIAGIVITTKPRIYLLGLLFLLAGLVLSAVCALMRCRLFEKSRAFTAGMILLPGIFSMILGFDKSSRPKSGRGLE